MNLYSSKAYVPLEFLSDDESTAMVSKEEVKPAHREKVRLYNDNMTRTATKHPFVYVLQSSDD